MAKATERDDRGDKSREELLELRPGELRLMELRRERLAVGAEDVLGGEGDKKGGMERVDDMKYPCSTRAPLSEDLDALLPNPLPLACSGLRPLPFEIASPFARPNDLARVRRACRPFSASGLRSPTLPCLECCRAGRGDEDTAGSNPRELLSGKSIVSRLGDMSSSPKRAEFCLSI